nr:MAG TPA: hypothetical protein [Caudoviricetes sp.]
MIRLRSQVPHLLSLVSRKKRVQQPEKYRLKQELFQTQVLQKTVFPKVEMVKRQLWKKLHTLMARRLVQPSLMRQSQKNQKRKLSPKVLNHLRQLPTQVY